MSAQVVGDLRRHRGCRTITNPQEKGGSVVFIRGMNIDRPGLPFPREGFWDAAEKEALASPHFPLGECEFAIF